MSKFKVGDLVRRVSLELSCVPIGFETTVLDKPGGVSSDDDEIWYEWPLGGGAVISNERHWEKIEPDSSSGSPVRTKTVTEIVPGVYGRISVSQQGGDEPRLLIALADLGGNVNVVHQGWSLDELSEAISNLTAIRDALQEQDK